MPYTELNLLTGQRLDISPEDEADIDAIQRELEACIHADDNEEEQTCSTFILWSVG